MLVKMKRNSKRLSTGRIMTGESVTNVTLDLWTIRQGLNSLFATDHWKTITSHSLGTKEEIKSCQCRYQTLYQPLKYYETTDIGKM